jgi:hypothetical protein
MYRSLYLFGVFFIFTASIPISAQNQQTNTGGTVRRRALVLNIDARVLDDEQTVIWNETHRKIAIPGNPVSVQLVGSNIVVSVQLTPFIRRNNGNVLVAQGQIWIDDPERGMCYYTSIQTIPMEFNEPIYFFPLGAAQQLGSVIEIVITVNPYSESEGAEETGVITGNER